MPAHVGVDIGSYAIKATGFSGRVGKQQLAVAGSVFNPVGQSLPSDPTAFSQLAQTLKQLASEHGFSRKPIAASLPESLAYTSIVTMPYLSEAELASSIHWEAEQHVPVPLEEVYLEYEVLHRPKKGSVGEKMQVLLVASKKEVVDRVQALFSEADLELIHLETGLLACYRAVASLMPETQGGALINLGALSTDVLIVDGGKPILSYTIQTGGLVFTRAVQQVLGLTGQQAEEYKRTYGFDQAQLEGKVRAALDPVMSILVGEIRKAVQYYQSSSSGNNQVRTMLLTGGGSYLPGMTAHLTESLSAEVGVVNPFQNMGAADKVEVPKDAAAYAVAAGLAANTQAA
jgi:type IV pilus assembly protein PilM